MTRMPGLPPRVFLLSPARAGGERMGLLLNPRAAFALASEFQQTGAPEAVLLGSIATGKYADLLLDILGDRLLFPPSFVGRGDMSRGGLLLRCVRAGMELPYAPLQGAIRHGPRPPKLPRY